MSNDFYSGIYNPDVLSCLANLSNDEVFTPPEVANSMLDMLPQELFSDPNTKFLDPACKSGVFLREIAKRLLTGLEPILPDLQQRIATLSARLGSAQEMEQEQPPQQEESASGKDKLISMLEALAERVEARAQDLELFLN